MWKLPIPKRVKELVEKKYCIGTDGNKKTGFMFLGHGSGTGKTLLGISILYSLVVQFKMKALYINTTLFFNELRGFYNLDMQNKMYNELSYLARLADVPVLMIDDLGAEKASEWMREKLYFILESRNMKDNKITLFTSNHLPDELSNTLGERIVSRIIEYNELSQFTGEDWRYKKKEGK